MYPALSVLANMLGADFQPTGSTNQGPAYAFWFRTKKGFVAVVWKNDYFEGDGEGKPVVLKLPAGMSAVDLMGNKLDGPSIELGEIPVYLLSAEEGTLREMFARK